MQTGHKQQIDTIGQIWINLKDPLSFQPWFQINAILRRSLKFSKLQHVKFQAINPNDEEVDQEILNAAREVIPNIVFE